MFSTRKKGIERGNQDVLADWWTGKVITERVRYLKYGIFPYFEFFD